MHECTQEDALCEHSYFYFHWSTFWKWSELAKALNAKAGTKAISFLSVASWTAGGNCLMSDSAACIVIKNKFVCLFLLFRDFFCSSFSSFIHASKNGNDWIRSISIGGHWFQTKHQPNKKKKRLRKWVFRALNRPAICYEDAFTTQQYKLAWLLLIPWHDCCASFAARSKQNFGRCQTKPSNPAPLPPPPLPST